MVVLRSSGSAAVSRTWRRSSRGVADWRRPRKSGTEWRTLGAPGKGDCIGSSMSFGLPGRTRGRFLRRGKIEIELAPGERVGANVACDFAAAREPDAAARLHRADELLEQANAR